VISRADRKKTIEDSRAVQRVRDALEGYAATAPGQDVSVNIAHVLDLLDPRGAWSLDPEYARARRAAPEKTLDAASADPLTGCKPVTPE